MKYIGGVSPIRVVGRRPGVILISTSRSASGYGSGLKSTAFMKLNISVLAPMPSASETTATAVKPGLPPSFRIASRRSRPRTSTKAIAGAPFRRRRDQTCGCEGAMIDHYR